MLALQCCSFSAPFLGDFFNAANYVVFGTPVINVNDSQFGRVTTQLNTPRRIQLAGKLYF